MIDGPKLLNDANSEFEMTTLHDGRRITDTNSFQVLSQVFGEVQYTANPSVRL